MRISILGLAALGTLAGMCMAGSSFPGAQQKFWWTKLGAPPYFLQLHFGMLVFPILVIYPHASNKDQPLILQVLQGRRFQVNQSFKVGIVLLTATWRSCCVQHTGFFGKVSTDVFLFKFIGSPVVLSVCTAGAATGS